MPWWSCLLHYVEPTLQLLAVNMRKAIGVRLPNARIDVACCKHAERLQQRLKYTLA